MSDLPIIYDEDEALEVLDEVGEHPWMTWDLETYGLNVVKDRIRGFGIAIDPNTAWYFPERFTEGPVWRKFLSYAESQLPKNGANLKFDAKVLKAQHGVNVEELNSDVILACHLLNETRNEKFVRTTPRPFSLWTQSGQFLLDSEQRDDVAVWDPNVDERDVAVHCINDVLNSERLRRVYDPLIQREGLQDYYSGLLLPLYRHFVDMELNGLPIDGKRLPKVLDEIERNIVKSQKRLRKYPEFRKVEEENQEKNPKHEDKWTFNVNSYKQVGRAIFEHAGIEPISYSDAGNAETGEHVLQELIDSQDYEPAKLILDIRKGRKLRDTYLLPWMENLDDDSRLRFGYKFHGTATGRLASGFHIFMHDEILESLVVAPDDRLLVHADYGQMEMRVAAMATGEERWVDAFNEGLDVYKVVASDFLEVPYDEVTPQMRDRAKTSALALVYGVQPGTLAGIWKASMEEAQFYREQFFKKYEQAAAWAPWIEEQIRTVGYVKTMFGRKRRFIVKGFNRFSGYMMNKAVNSPIQGAASDICLERGMAVVEHFGGPVIDLGYVHDSADFEIPRKGWKSTVRQIIEIMESVPGFDFPFAVDIFVGTSWNRMKDAKKLLAIS